MAVVGKRPLTILEALRREDSSLSKAAMRARYPDLVHRIAQFIDQCVQAGELVTDAQDRRIIRSIIQYWATYQYTHTGHYHLPNLARTTAAFGRIGAGEPNKNPGPGAT